MIWFIKKKKKKDLFCIFLKNSFWWRKKKKIRYVLLSKTKSFGSKISDLFWELKKKKKVFGLYVKKKKNQIYFVIKNLESLKKSNLFFMWKKKRIFFIRGLHSWNKPTLLASNKTKHHYSWPFYFKICNV